MLWCRIAPVLKPIQNAYIRWKITFCQLYADCERVKTHSRCIWNGSMRFDFWWIVVGAFTGYHKNEQTFTVYVLRCFAKESEMKIRTQNSQNATFLMHAARTQPTCICKIVLLAFFISFSKAILCAQYIVVFLIHSFISVYMRCVQATLLKMETFDVYCIFNIS